MDLAAIAVKDSASMGHINDTQTSVSTSSKPFTNSQSCNLITANQKTSIAQPAPVSTPPAPTGTATPPPSVSTLAPAAPVSTQQEAKTKQSVQNDFAVSVLRRHNEIEKQKVSSAPAAQPDMKPESSSNTSAEPEKHEEASNAVDSNSQIVVNRSAATEIPKSAVAIGPRHPSATAPQQQQQASSPSSKVSVPKPSSETAFSKFAPVQDDGMFFFFK
jgi:hypothetical protein